MAANLMQTSKKLVQALNSRGYKFSMQEIRCFRLGFPSKAPKNSDLCCPKAHLKAPR